MPLIAYAEDGSEVESFDVPADVWRTWRALPVGAFKVGPYRWPAVLKRSPLGLQFFAHAPGCEATTEPETIYHQLAKIGLVRGLRAAGIPARLEVAGSTPDGSAWQADVLAQIGGRTTALEVQWSHQHWDEYSLRTERYAASGVDCIWVARASQRNAIYTHRAKYWVQLGHPRNTITIGRGLFDMPMVWIDSPKTPTSPGDLRIQSFLHDGAVWVTPEQFSGGLARGAFHYAPGKFGSEDWRFDPAVAGIIPAGHLPKT